MLANQLKTFILLTLIGGLLVAFGQLVGGMHGAFFAFVLAVIMNFFSYYYAAKIVLSAYGAVPLKQSEYPEVYAIVAELAAQAHIPMPKLFLINSPMANAFATGRSPANSVVAVTSGILKILTPAELRGVLAHEISHIRNWDILIASVAATFAIAISYIASMIRWSLFWGSSDRENNRSGIALLLAAILMPIAATLIQLAISRSREFEADATGAQISRSPHSLASALLKLDASAKVHDFKDASYAQQAASSMFICCPFTKKSVTNLFSTHPATEERVKRLEQMRF